MVFREHSEYEECNTGVFASSPDDFKGSEDIVTTDKYSFYGTGTDVDGLGVNVRLPVVPCHHKDPSRRLIWDSYLAIIACKRASQRGSYIGIVLWRPHMLYHPQSHLRMTRLAFRERGGQIFSSTFDLDPRLTAKSDASDLALLKTPTFQLWDEEHPMNKVTLIVEISEPLNIGVDVPSSMSCNLNVISDPQDIKHICLDSTFRDILSDGLPHDDSCKGHSDFSLHLKALNCPHSPDSWSIEMSRHTIDETNISIWFVPGDGSDPELVQKKKFLSRKMAMLYVKAPKASAIGEFYFEIDELHGFPTRHIHLRLNPPRQLMSKTSKSSLV